ncbi:MAG: carbamoyltransferase [Ignavibacteria bacterium]|nr:carbamoyltransferase [Ignavibacteria bacterium]
MQKPEYILGISAFYHDSAACLLKNGEIIAAAQEERFTRIKQDHNFPRRSVQYCLKQAGITPEDLTLVAFYDKPLLKFSRLLETYLQFAPRGLSSFIKSVPLWLSEKLWMEDIIKKQIGYSGRVIFPEHHESHAASAFFASPFEKAAFLTVDGVGEWATTSYGIGDGNSLNLMAEIRFPHSLGLLYSAFTYYTGFKVNSGEYKVMGLAPYGEPKYVDLIMNELVDLKEDGSFIMNMKYFDYCAGLTMTNQAFNNLFGGPARVPETNLTQKDLDLAASIQVVTENIILKMAAHIKRETGEKFLCLAGGVALNCVANGKLLQSGIFEDIWIQPAAGDAGGALGAALTAHYCELKNQRAFTDRSKRKDFQKGSYLGPEYTNRDIQEFLDSNKLPYTFVQDAELYRSIAVKLEEGKIIGWFQGRMEFGPRALGNRSIIGDARNRAMQKQMNIKIKFREGFRPFAPSVLAEHISEWFSIDRESPYMLLVADVNPAKQREMTEAERALWGIDKLNIIRSEIPAVTHVDYSARIQSVNKEDNPRYHALISEFYKLTGCPVIVNTSFNVRGEPIVESPLDAYKCFMRTDLDILVLGNYILVKEQQPVFHDTINWKEIYELD